MKFPSPRLTIRCLMIVVEDVALFQALARQWHCDPATTKYAAIALGMAGAVIVAPGTVVWLLDSRAGAYVRKRLDEDRSPDSPPPEDQGP